MTFKEAVQYLNSKEPGKAFIYNPEIFCKTTTVEKLAVGCSEGTLIWYKKYPEEGWASVRRVGHMFVDWILSDTWKIAE